MRKITACHTLSKAQQWYPILFSCALGKARMSHLGCYTCVSFPKTACVHAVRYCFLPLVDIRWLVTRVLHPQSLKWRKIHALSSRASKTYEILLSKPFLTATSRCTSWKVSILHFKFCGNPVWNARNGESGESDKKITCLVWQKIKWDVKMRPMTWRIWEN